MLGQVRANSKDKGFLAVSAHNLEPNSLDTSKPITQDETLELSITFAI